MPARLDKSEFTNRQKYSYADKKLTLFDSTRLKYDVATSFLNKTGGIRSLIDVGCADGAIGLALKQDFPHIETSLATYQPQRVDVRLYTDFKEKAGFIFCDVFEPHQELKRTYDLVLMFAVVHQFLGQQRSAESVLSLIEKLTGKYCIVELPVNNDRRLLKQKQKYNSDGAYAVLANKETAFNWLAQKLDVIECFPVDYGLRLDRHIFILKKRD